MIMTQAICQGRSGASLIITMPASSWKRRCRVNLDLFHILDDVDQVTFLRHNGDNLDIMNSSGYMDVIPFQYDDRIAPNRYKTMCWLPIESLDSSRSGRYVYIRRVNDTDPRKGTLGILWISYLTGINSMSCLRSWAPSWKPGY